MTDCAMPEPWRIVPAGLEGKETAYVVHPGHDGDDCYSQTSHLHHVVGYTKGIHVGISGETAALVGRRDFSLGSCAGPKVWKVLLYDPLQHRDVV